MKALGIAVVTEISGIILAFNAFFVVQVLFYVGIAGNYTFITVNKWKSSSLCNV